MRLKTNSEFPFAEISLHVLFFTMAVIVFVVVKTVIGYAQLRKSY